MNDWKRNVIRLPPNSPQYPIFSPFDTSRGFPNITAIGKLDIIKNKKVALICSIKCPGNLILKTYDLAVTMRDQGIAVIGGFHSPMEKECLRLLLRGTQPVIICLARSFEAYRMPGEYRRPLEDGRLLLISCFENNDKRITKQTSEQRNRLIGALADEVFVSYADAGGMTEKLCREIIAKSKTVKTF